MVGKGSGDGAHSGEEQAGWGLEDSVICSDRKMKRVALFFH